MSRIIIPAMIRVARIVAAVFTLWAAATPLSAQDPESSSQKPALLNALQALESETRRVMTRSGSDTALAAPSEDVLRSVLWFAVLADSWMPKDEQEDKGLRESLERMTQAIRRTQSDAQRREMLTQIADDLEAKVEHCRKEGLGARQQVKVTTKRQGLFEVKGLEVLYLEKFFAVDPAATPRQFQGFSSPAVDLLVPGRYVFWARDPADVEDWPAKGSTDQRGAPERSD